MSFEYWPYICYQQSRVHKKFKHIINDLSFLSYQYIRLCNVIITVFHSTVPLTNNHTLYFYYLFIYLSLSTYIIIKNLLYITRKKMLMLLWDLKLTGEDGKMWGRKSSARGVRKRFETVWYREPLSRVKT